MPLMRRMAMLATAAETARRYARKNPDKAAKYLDQAAAFVDKQTKGKYSGQIRGVVDKAKNAAGIRQAPGHDAPGHGGPSSSGPGPAAPGSGAPGSGAPGSAAPGPGGLGSDAAGPGRTQGYEQNAGFGKTADYTAPPPSSPQPGKTGPER